MKKITVVVLLLTAFLTLFSSYRAISAQDDSLKARQWAEQKGEAILQILADKDLSRKYAELDKILYEDIDLDHAARFVVGRYWRNMSNEQKEKYVPLFKRYTASVYKSFPLDIPENSIGYEISDIKPNKNFYDVFCLINLNKQSTQGEQTESPKIRVVFSLIEQNGKILLRDLKIGESSLLIAYRERFYKMIHQDNDDEIDWFLEDLENITADNEAENQRLIEAN